MRHQPRLMPPSPAAKPNKPTSRCSSYCGIFITELNTADADQAPHVSQDGLTIAFASSRAGGAGHVDLYMATRENLSDPFGAPVNLSTVNTSALENTPRFTDDLLTLYFY